MKSYIGLLEKLLSKENLETPAFVYAEAEIISNLIRLREFLEKTSFVSLLFSLKSFAFLGALKTMSELVNGFSVSSLFEARFAKQHIGPQGTIHITTPGLKSSEISSIGEICDYLSFNSITQWELFKNSVGGNLNCGLRVNPQLSLLADNRYDPCRINSKLGVPMTTLAKMVREAPEILEGINGLHFHSNCDATNLTKLFITVRHIEEHLSDYFQQIEWINLGGGYLFNEANNTDAFYKAVDLLKSKYELAIFIEPGASIVRDAGFLISSVLDVFESDGKKVVILDTTVNHTPEVFEYQFEPDVMGHNDKGRFEYILAGCSCLAGDIFGEYAFDEPLQIGSKIIFSNMGAYTLVKAHTFNGINLPAIYKLTRSGQLILEKQFTYEDYAYRNGVEEHAPI